MRSCEGLRASYEKVLAVSVVGNAGVTVAQCAERLCAVTVIEKKPPSNPEVGFVGAISTVRSIESPGSWIGDSGGGGYGPPSVMQLLAQSTVPAHLPRNWLRGWPPWPIREWSISCLTAPPSSIAELNITIRLLPAVQ